MTDPVFRITIPVDRWSAADYVPNAAVEATRFGTDLVCSGTRLVGVEVRSSPIAGDQIHGFQVASRLRWRLLDGLGIAMSVAVRVSALGNGADELAMVRGTVESAWSSDQPVEVLPDTAETFALAFGCLEPVARAAEVIQSAFTMIGIDVEAGWSEVTRENMQAVHGQAGQPPMSSDLASPMNHYALRGIPGDQAEQWAANGFPPVEAAPWFQLGVKPLVAFNWLELGRTIEDARPWVEAGATPDEADTAESVGAGVDEYLIARGLFVDLESFVDIESALRDDLEDSREVTTELIVEWLNALDDKDLLGVGDIVRFIEAGLTSDQIAVSPTDLTATDVIRYWKEGFVPDVDPPIWEQPEGHPDSREDASPAHDHLWDDPDEHGDDLT